MRAGVIDSTAQMTVARQSGRLKANRIRLIPDKSASSKKLFASPIRDRLSACQQGESNTAAVEGTAACALPPASGFVHPSSLVVADGSGPRRKANLLKLAHSTR
jgi:hypothetical protein